MRKLALLAFALAAVGCNARPLALSDDGEAVLQALGTASGPKVFLVQLRPGYDVDQTLDDLALGNGFSVTHRYHHALSGGALLVPTAAARAALDNDPRVLAVIADQALDAVAKPAPAPAPPPGPTEPTGYRLSGAKLTDNEGANAYVAVLDSGLDVDHTDLAANVDLSRARDCVNESGAPLDDLNGHGTHVAGTIAAMHNGFGSYGVGAQIKIIPVKVLNRRGSGSWATIVCGIDHVTALRNADPSLNVVANMSLGGIGTECSTATCTKSALQSAIEASVAAGVAYAVAAGNESDDAANHVPGAYDAVITVSAYGDQNGTLDDADFWPSFTNFGADVDIAAPGYAIYSTTKANGYTTKSGTSMACPHVAAAGALYLSTHPGASPAAVKAALLAAAHQTYAIQNATHPEPLLDVSGGFPADPLPIDPPADPIPTP